MLVTYGKFLNFFYDNLNSDMNLIFIGMSNIGKTRMTDILCREFGVQSFGVDDEINNLIGRYLTDFKGETTLEKRADFLGLPWDKGFTQREEWDLAQERRVMESLDCRGKIIDLPGSAIYHPDQMERLAETGLVVYLEANKKAEAKLVQDYIAVPKPTSWRGHFKAREGESHPQTLERCYPELLKSRAELYKQYADVTLSYKEHARFPLFPIDFINIIAEKL